MEVFNVAPRNPVGILTLCPFSTSTPLPGNTISLSCKHELFELPHVWLLVDVEGQCCTPWVWTHFHLLTKLACYRSSYSATTIYHVIQWETAVRQIEPQQQQESESKDGY